MQKNNKHQKGSKEITEQQINRVLKAKLREEKKGKSGEKDKNICTTGGRTTIVTRR